MESLFVTLLSGDLNVTTLLILFIVALLTKRFVPWWVYEAMEERLRLYEEEAPELIKEVKELLNAVDDKVDEKKESSRTYKLVRGSNGNSRRKPKRGGKDVNS